MPVRKDTPLCDFVVPYGTKGAPMMGSTDVGDVSWVVPTVQARVATHAIGTPGHSWQITAQGKSGQAKKGMVHAAKVMAGVAVDALGDPALIARAKADHKARTDVDALRLSAAGRRQAADPAAAEGGVSRVAQVMTAEAAIDT